MANLSEYAGVRVTKDGSTDDYVEVRVIQGGVTSTVWTASRYVVQDGVIHDSNLVSSVNVSELSVSAGNDEENEQTYTVFTLQNADAYSKVKIRFKYRLYVGFGQAAIYINDTLYSNTADNVEHTVEMYVNTKTCTVKLYAKNESSEPTWGADSVFQLLDIYVER